MSPNLKEMKGTKLKNSRTELQLEEMKGTKIKNSKTELQLGGKHILN